MGSGRWRGSMGTTARWCLAAGPSTRNSRSCRSRLPTRFGQMQRSSTARGSAWRPMGAPCSIGCCSGPTGRTSSPSTGCPSTVRICAAGRSSSASAGSGPSCRGSSHRWSTWITSLAEGPTCSLSCAGRIWSEATRAGAPSCARKRRSKTGDTQTLPQSWIQRED
jgi:hypothetical protein